MSAEIDSFSEGKFLQGKNMRYDRLRHYRQSMRLKGWDYTLPGWYYVTIVVKDREQHFGHVVYDSVEYSPLGFIADACWKEIPEHHFGAELDEYIVMPNHLHGIVIINRKPRALGNIADGIVGGVGRKFVPCGAVQLNAPTTTSQVHVLTRVGLNVPNNDRGLARKQLSPVQGSLSVIIRTFKAAVTT